MVIAINTYAVGEISHSKTHFKDVEWEPTTRYFWYISYFGYLWFMALIIAVSQFIIITAVCTWYFSHAGDKEGEAKVLKGLKWTFRYHFGSLAFGSAILAIVWLIRTMFEYMRKKLNKADRTGIMKTILCICSCCLYCLNRFVKFLTKNAYIQVALKSSNFCVSAWNAFILVLRNIVKFGFVNTVGTIFIFVGKFLIAGLAGALAFVVAAYWPWITNRITSPIIPAIACALIGYVIASIFMSIFSIASNTILQCFILDTEIAQIKSDGGANHQPQCLQGFVDAIEDRYHKKVNNRAKKENKI